MAADHFGPSAAEVYDERVSDRVEASLVEATKPA
jgi:hypothetical protein